MCPAVPLGDRSPARQKTPAAEIKKAKEAYKKKRLWDEASLNSSDPEHDMHSPCYSEKQSEIELNEHLTCLDGLARIAEAQSLNGAASLFRAIAAQLEAVMAERSSGASEDGGAATMVSPEPE